MASLFDALASDKSFAYGQGIVHEIIENGGTYGEAKKFLVTEKNFKPDTAERIIETVKNTRRGRIERGEEPSQPSQGAATKDQNSQKKSKTKKTKKTKTKSTKPKTKKAEALAEKRVTRKTPRGEREHFEGWSQERVINTWKSLGGTFSKCVKKMKGHVDDPEAYCSALQQRATGSHPREANKYFDDEIVTAYNNMIRDASQRDNMIKKAQTPSPWEPNVPGTRRVPNDWFNLSWEGLMERSRKGNEYVDLGDVPLDRRLFDHHSETPSDILEAELDEYRPVLRTLEYDEPNNYWDELGTIEGRMVNRGINDVSETWSGNISPLERRRI